MILLFTIRHSTSAVEKGSEVTRYMSRNTPINIGQITSAVFRGFQDYSVLVYCHSA
jgi:hypothetical protein